MQKKSGKKSDKWITIGVLLLSFFGVLMVFDSSVAIAIRDFSDQYYFAREQFKWLLIGLVGFMVAAKIPYQFWYKLALPSLLLTLLLLLVVFIPGVGISALGANRWINFGFFVLQPAEFAKLALVIYLSAWFSSREKGRLGAFLLLVAMVVGLVILEPDLGTSIILLGIALALYYFSGVALSHFLFLLPIITAGVLLLAVTSPYRAQRLLTFFNTEHDPLGASYQVRQGLLAFGSGGWFGVGIGKSRQKYEYLPEANTDSIFAIIGEEIGFVGASMVLSFFLFVIWRCFRIAARVSDGFGRFLVFGIASWLAIQVCINAGSMVALVPLTGVPLPFISYGGSSLIILLFAMGIVSNVSTSRHE